MIDIITLESQKNQQVASGFQSNITTNDNKCKKEGGETMVEERKER